MSGAGTALAAAAAEALRAVDGLHVFEAPPLQAGAPYALVQAGPETDWGHKSGAGREVRLTVTLAVRGERGEALSGLAESAEAAAAGVARWRAGGSSACGWCAAGSCRRASPAPTAPGRASPSGGRGCSRPRPISATAPRRA